MLHHIGKPTGTGLEDWSITAQKFSLLLDVMEQKGLPPLPSKSQTDFPFN
ncbi:hypothetical protein [Pedobacter kyonggii]|nr:hypothetical protein [Pedobacter kyonggii]